MQEDKVRFYAANWPQDHWPNFAFNELARSETVECAMNMMTCWSW
jgi:hypothetical protein